MQTLSLSKKTFQSLPLLDIPNSVYNTEGKIYDFSYKRQQKVLKTLYHLDGAIFANKLYTLEMLNTYKNYLPDNFYIPDCLISVANELVGFTVPKIDGVSLSVLLADKKMDCKEKIYYLKQVGFILEKLKNIRTYTSLQEFYLNDLHASNFVVNAMNKEVGVVDLDSCKIASNYPFPSRFLTPNSLANLVPEKYIVASEETPGGGYIVANEESDLFCYTIMILNYLYGDNVHHLPLAEYYEYLNYLETLGISKDLIEASYYLVVPHHNENPLLYLDSLTDEQIYRANSKIYARVKAK